LNGEKMATRILQLFLGCLCVYGTSSKATHDINFIVSDNTGALKKQTSLRLYVEVSESREHQQIWKGGDPLKGTFHIQVKNSKKAAVRFYWNTEHTQPVYCCRYQSDYGTIIIPFERDERYLETVTFHWFSGFLWEGLRYVGGVPRTVFFTNVPLQWS
jgi:hypothetical protein